jgi:peroxiredoxin
MTKKAFFTRLSSMILTIFVLFCHLATAGNKEMGFAIPFPDLTFQQQLSRSDQTYLGIPKRQNFSFRDIQGSLILVEFTSMYCTSCQKQAPIFNDLYSSIEKDPGVKGKVKMVGIASGNNLTEIDSFRKQHGIPYPILADPKFTAHEAVGSPRTPFTLWVRRDSQRKSIVVSTHMGLIDSVDRAFNETRAVSQYDLALLKPKKGAIYEGDALKPPLSEEKLMEKAKEGMEVSGGKVLEIKKVSLKDGDWIYIGKIDFGTHQENLFSKLASRRAICDVCHDTFILYTFDVNGKVTEIVPIQLTKIDNLNWTEGEVGKIRERIIGKSIFKSFAFDPRVDSVSGATITAALVFDSLDKAKEIYEKLKKEGYLKK